APMYPEAGDRLTSVTGLPIDQVLKRLAALEGRHLLEHDRDKMGRVRRRGGMRRDEDLGMAPHRACPWQRLDLEHVEAGLFQRAVIQGAKYVGILLKAPTSGIDQNCPAEPVCPAQFPQEPVIDDAARGRR